MLEKILGYIKKGQKEGAKLMTGGKRIGTSGYYVEPTVFTDVTDEMAIAREEVCIYVKQSFHNVLKDTYVGLNYHTFCRRHLLGLSRLPY